jgi:hypothetical protein
MATFKHFPYLPPEIRILIWEEAATIPAKDPIVADFGGTLFKIPRPKPLGQLKCQFFLRFGFGCKSLGTFGANLESREASLRMNPDFLQFNKGPKLYFDAERNTIHFDFQSLYFIGLYFDQNLHNEDLMSNETEIQVRVSSAPRKHDLVRNLRGFCRIKTMSVPPFIHDTSLAIIVLFYSAADAATAFRNVTGIIPKSLPNNRNKRDMWGKFVNGQIDDLFLKDIHTTGFGDMRLEHDRTTYSRRMWQRTASMCTWPAWWPTWMTEEIGRISRLLEAPSS